MTLEEAEMRLTKIKNLADDYDDESAHSEEDQFHVDVLAWIAIGGADAAALAAIALKTDDIEFARWCA